jgi:glycine/D-amino acid oxidase-like deaminating enzyme
MRQLQTEVLVVGGGVGGTAAAIQAARCGSRVVLVSEGDWLGGMLTSAGVSAPDGNELRSWQTGLWGQFLGELYRQQPGGLHHSWVSFFSYEPAIGARIFAQWVEALPQLTWIVGGAPLGVVRQEHVARTVIANHQSPHAIEFAQHGLTPVTPSLEDDLCIALTTKMTP